MNSIPKIMLPVSLVLLLNACAHHPRQYSYYPDTGSYSSGYTVIHRNYYGGTYGYYDNDYGWDKGNFPHHHHDQHNAPPPWNKDYPRPHYQHGNRSDNNRDGHNFNHRVENENYHQYSNHDGDNRHPKDHHQRFND